MSQETPKIQKMTLTELREQVNLTQKELGEIIGVTDQTISNWEQARAIPRLTVRQVVEMLTVLPCTLYQLAEICEEIERQVKARQEVKKNDPKAN